MTQWDIGHDAAYPANLRGSTGVILGYLVAPNALNGWTATEWGWFEANYKIPIWVGGMAGEAEGWGCLQQLYALGVPSGKGIILDLETRIDKTYVNAFGSVLQWAGFKVWPYGSASTLFQNPQLNGYAVADPTGVPHMYPHPGVRITQYAFNGSTDSDAVKDWLIQDAEVWK